MVSDFRVEKEQFGAKRYVGSFTFRFRQNPMRGVFGSQYIPSPHELAARAPVETQTVTTVVTSTSETPDAVQVVPVEDEATSIINSEAAQAPPPLTVAADNAMPPGVDINSPIKMMLIEVPVANSAALQMAKDKLSTAPGVMTLSYTSSGRAINMSYRGDTMQLVNGLKMRGVTLQPKLPTQPPIYTLAP